MSQFQLDEVEASLLSLLASSMSGAYGEPVQVDSLGDSDFDDDGVLVLQPPAVRVKFAGAEYDGMRDNRALTYEAGVFYDVLFFQSSLRDKADERRQSMQLTKAGMNQLAGARIGLPDGTASMPIQLKSVSLVIAEGSEVPQAFALRILVRGIAQFDGPNGGSN